MPLVNVCFSVSCKYSLYDHHQLKHSLAASNRLSNGCLIGRLIDAFLGLTEYRWLSPGEWNVCMGKYECRNELRDVNENKVEVRGRCMKGVYVNGITCFFIKENWSFRLYLGALAIHNMLASSKSILNQSQYSGFFSLGSCEGQFNICF